MKEQAQRSWLFTSKAAGLILRQKTNIHSRKAISWKARKTLQNWEEWNAFHKKKETLTL